MATHPLVFSSFKKKYLFDLFPLSLLIPCSVSPFPLTGEFAFYAQELWGPLPSPQTSRDLVPERMETSGS
jgi:hypothetical protein